MYNTSTIAIIIPAFNEAPRVPAVIDATLNSKLTDQIIVINDGSTDETLVVLQKYSNEIALINNEKNQGKAFSLLAGLNRSHSDYILFLDSDLGGLSGLKIDEAIKFCIDGTFDMVRLMLQIPESFRWLDTLKLSEVICGSRLLKREKLKFLDDSVNDLGYGIEAHIDGVARESSWKTDNYLWIGVTHPLKYQKGGLSREIKEGLKMSFQVVCALHKQTYFKSFFAD